MSTIRRILCPVDFSRFSHHALEQSVALAREFGAEITALHVFGLAPVMDVVPAGARMAMEPIRMTPSQRRALASEVRDFTCEVEAGGVGIKIVVADGDPVATIVEHAATWPADLIVMGTHGRTGFDRLLLGSVAENVLPKARCPVLTVPRRVVSPTHGLIFGRILCAVDFSPASLRALGYAATLAAADGPGIDVLNVVEISAEGRGPRDGVMLDAPDFRTNVTRMALQRLAAAIPGAVRARCPIREVITLGKAYKEILRIAAEQGSELVVLGVHGRTVADRLIFGSTTQHVVRQAACPVLTIRA
jgi:nucleotide-binding universal stress UspA family protein